MSANAESLAATQVSVDGERLHVVRSEGRGTPLLICNDFVANAAVLADVMIALDPPVVAFDLPGIGESGEVRRMRRMSALAVLVEGMLDALGLDGPIDVMGIGWGGLLAQQFARDAGERTRRLVLAATSGGQLMFPGRLAALWKLARPNALGAVAGDGAHARAVFGGRRTDECQGIGRAMIRARAPTRRGYAAQLYALTGYSSLPWLHRLSVPTLVLAGDDDPVVPTVNARVLALLLPQSRLVVIRGGGHWFLLERTDEVARELDGFLGARAGAIPARGDNML